MTGDLAHNRAGEPILGQGLLQREPFRLIGGRCRACASLRFPMRRICAECQQDMAPAELSTVGTLYTFTIVRSAPPGYRGEVPYALGVVELTDGIRVSTTVTADDLDAIMIGQEVTLEPLTLGDGAEAFTSFAFRTTGDRG